MPLADDGPKDKHCTHCATQPMLIAQKQRRQMESPRCR